MALPPGLIGALMSGGPLPIPQLPCAVCTGVRQRDTTVTTEPQTAVTLAAGWLVCGQHAGDLADHLASQRYEDGIGPDPIRRDGTARKLSELL